MSGSQNSSAPAGQPTEEKLAPPESKKNLDQEIQKPARARLSKKLGYVVPEGDEDARQLESKGFGSRHNGQYHLKDYEVLYLLYNSKLVLTQAGKEISFTTFVDFALTRDENAWTRFLIFRDLRSRGYVVREGFGFPIDFRVYDRGDYGEKAAKYIVFGLNEGKTMTVTELKKHVEQMGIMGKEAVISVVERRGEVIYYKVAKWRPSKPSD